MMIVEGRVYPDTLVALPGSELNKTAAFSSLQRIGGGRCGGKCLYTGPVSVLRPRPELRGQGGWHVKTVGILPEALV